MKLWHKVMVLGCSVLLGGFALTACSSGSNEESSTQETTKEMTDFLGNKVEVPTKPKKIIASYLEDYLVALDTIPVAQWSVKGGTVQNYLQDKLKDVPTISYDLPYEAVLSFEPDLLLMASSSTVEGGKYKDYSKIAPTYVVKNGEKVTWREQLEDIANVLGKKEKGEEIVTTYEELADKTAKELDKKVEKQSIAVLWVTNNQVFMVSQTRSSGALLYGDLKMEVPALVEEVSKDATADWSAVSLEKLGELDADYLILINSDTSATLFEEDIWKNLPAVQNNQVLEFSGDSSWLYNGPIANTLMIEDIRKTILK